MTKLYVMFSEVSPVCLVSLPAKTPDLAVCTGVRGGFPGDGSREAVG